MINSTYLYFVFFFVLVFVVILFINLKPNKTHTNNKILLKTLLESFELELPDELKRLDNSSNDSHEMS